MPRSARALTEEGSSGSAERASLSAALVSRHSRRYFVAVAFEHPARSRTFVTVTAAPSATRASAAWKTRSLSRTLFPAQVVVSMPAIGRRPIASPIFLAVIRSLVVVRVVAQYYSYFGSTNYAPAFLKRVRRQSLSGELSTI